MSRTQVGFDWDFYKTKQEDTRSHYYFVSSGAGLVFSALKVYLFSSSHLF